MSTRFTTTLNHLKKHLPDWLLGSSTFATSESGELGQDSEFGPLIGVAPEPVEPEDALLLASQVAPGPYYQANHRLVLDLDHDAVLIPSSTPGHSHLIVDVRLTKGELNRVLKTLAEAGVIEGGYAESGIDSPLGTTVRLPWVKKGEDKTLAEQLGWKKPENTNDHTEEDLFL